MPSDQQELTDAKNYTRERWKQFKAENRKLRQENDELRNALASLPDSTGEPVEIAEVVAKAAQIAGDACWSRPMPKDWDRDKDAYTDWCAEQSKFVREKILALATPPDAEQARLRERVVRSPTNDQIAAVMLQTGSPEQAKQALEYAGVIPPAEARLAQAERATAVTGSVPKLLDDVRKFIEVEYADHSAEPDGEWLAKEARHIHAKVCAALAEPQQAVTEAMVTAGMRAYLDASHEPNNGVSLGGMRAALEAALRTSSTGGKG